MIGWISAELYAGYRAGYAAAIEDAAKVAEDDYDGDRCNRNKDVLDAESWPCFDHGPCVAAAIRALRGGGKK